MAGLSSREILRRSLRRCGFASGIEIMLPKWAPTRAERPNDSVGTRTGTGGSRYYRPLLGGNTEQRARSKDEMLAILTTHPIQYQVPLWQRLSADGRVPLEVWYLSEHATRLSRDIEFGKEFAWDLDMLKGYRYRILKTPADATPNTFWRSRITESLPALFRETKTRALWV